MPVFLARLDGPCGQAEVRISASTRAAASRFARENYWNTQVDREPVGGKPDVTVPETKRNERHSGA